MSITRLQQARQMYAMGQRVAKTLDGSRPDIVVLITEIKLEVQALIVEVIQVQQPEELKVVEQDQVIKIQVVEVMMTEAVIYKLIITT